MSLVPGARRGAHRDPARGRPIRRAGAPAGARTPARGRARTILAALAAAALAARGAWGAEAGLARADSLRWVGRWEEARAAYAAAPAGRAAEAAVGIARCLAAVGNADQAIETLSAAASKHPDTAAIPAELAALELERGDYDAAQKHVDRALALDESQCAARYLAAELDRVKGSTAEANEAYRWLVRYYNRERDRITDPEKLLWIGRAAAQYARWNRNAGQFSFLVNTLYPAARRLEPRFWPSHLEAALLFIEKYNPVDAGVELDSALAINPRAAELHAVRAMIALEQSAFDSARVEIDRALAINPHLDLAYRLKADLEMSVFGPQGAVPLLEQAARLGPGDAETLGRLAAAYGAVDGLRDTVPGTRMRGVIDAAVARNPHCGEFFAALAAALDRLRKYPHAARYYEEAMRRMPELIAAPGQLGMVWMRLGDETSAARLLQESFRIDPFNARVKNTLDVLDLLQGYGTIESEHFVVRYDRRDSLLAKYAARWLEEGVYPEITSRLGFRPPGKSLFEIFSAARGTSGQSWFAARMAGLPFIGTVAGCAGKMVGLSAPGEMRTRFDWARVLKHEFVHVVNLQQTDFNIPHWFTEGLAVYHEGGPRPPGWEVTLARRAAAGRLFTLETIDLGFLRPSVSDDWTLAYFQAELYCEYMAEAYGKDAIPKMVAAYADNLDTRRALQRCFQVGQEAFEAGYRKYVEKVAAAVGPEERAQRPGLAVLERAVARDPKDFASLAQLADAYLDAGTPARARGRAEAALALAPRQPLATYVVARIRASAGEKKEARALLEAAVNVEAPEPKSLGLLAGLSLELADSLEAERLYRVGAAHFPHDDGWLRSLVPLHEAARDTAKLAEALARLAELDDGDAAIREQLARIARARSDPKAAAAWAEKALHFDVANAGAHAILAETAAMAGRFDQAAYEYENAIRLGSKQKEWLLGLARACARTHRSERAREALRDLLETDPEYPGARELLETLR
jgi:Tfp pilus assembly protein PilF